VPPWVISAEGIAQFGVDSAAEIISVIDPAIAPLVQAVKTGFDAVTAALQAYEKALQTSGPNTTLLQAIQIAFATLQTQAANLLNSFPGSGSATDTIISAVIGLIASAVSNLSSLLASASAAAGIDATNLKVSRAFPVANGWTKNDFKSRFNADVHGDSRFHKI